MQWKENVLLKTVSLQSTPLLVSTQLPVWTATLKSEARLTESYFLEMPLVISYAFVFACVLVALCAYTVRRLRWTLSYGSSLKKEQEKAG